MLSQNNDSKKNEKCYVVLTSLKMDLEIDSKRLKQTIDHPPTHYLYANEIENCIYPHGGAPSWKLIQGPFSSFETQEDARTFMIDYIEKTIASGEALLARSKDATSSYYISCQSDVTHL